MRNKLAMFLPHHALASLRVHFIDMSTWLTPQKNDQFNFNDQNFEKDVSQAVGFRNGLNLWEDLVHSSKGGYATDETRCGLLGLIAILNFCERIDHIYEGVLTDFKTDDIEIENYLMLNLLYMS